MGLGLVRVGVRVRDRVRARVRVRPGLLGRAGGLRQLFRAAGSVAAGLVG